MRTVFYSWQSDLPGSENRNFIQDAIEYAIQLVNANLHSDVDFEERPDAEKLMMDRDTQDVPGTPDIPSVIFHKIENATTFIADVSIVNHSFTKKEMIGEDGVAQTVSCRRMPNPNVMLELGYAVKALGWDRVVCVYNTDYGSLDDLPFDIRVRRPLPYSLAEFRNGSKTKGDLKREIGSRIAQTLQSDLELLQRTNSFSHLKPENERYPHLYLSYRSDISENDSEPIEDIFIDEAGIIHFTVQPIDMSDAMNGITYKDYAGRESQVSFNEVKLFRYVCKNSFSVLFHIINDGDSRATGVRIRLRIPDGLSVIAMQDLLEYIEPDPITFSKDAYEGWDTRFFEPNDTTSVENTPATTANKFISLDELTTVEAISELLNPAYDENGISVFPGIVELEFEEVRHKDSTFFRGVYILPTAPGIYEIQCELLCNEYADAVSQKIVVVVE